MFPYRIDNLTRMPVWISQTSGTSQCIAMWRNRCTCLRLRITEGSTASFTHAAASCGVGVITQLSIPGKHWLRPLRDNMCKKKQDVICMEKCNSIKRTADVRVHNSQQQMMSFCWSRGRQETVTGARVHSLVRAQYSALKQRAIDRMRKGDFTW